MYSSASRPHRVLPNGEPKKFSPVASTLIYGSESAVLTDPAFSAEQARTLGDWVAGKGRKLTDTFITYGHGDHWFAAGLLAERFGARVVATAGTIAQMHGNLAARPFLWDKMFPGMIPPSPVTAVTVPANHFTLEGHDLVMVEVGHTDSADTSVLHIPDLGLVVAGDAIYNRVHTYLGASVAIGGFGPWRNAIDKIQALNPRHIIAGHQNKQQDDDADRLIAETRQYLDDADQSCRPRKPPSTSSMPSSRGIRITGGGPCCGSGQYHLRRARTPRRGRRRDHGERVALSFDFQNHKGNDA